MATLNEVNIAFNPIGTDGGIALRDALKTSNIRYLGIGKKFTTADGSHITRSFIQKKVFLAVAGRIGEVTEVHSGGNHIKLKWQNDSSTSGWTKINSLDGVPLNLPLQTEFEGDSLDLSRQQLDPGYALLLAWWLTTSFSATVTKIDIRGNDLSVESLATLKGAAPEGCEVVVKK